MGGLWGVGGGGGLFYSCNFDICPARNGLHMYMYLSKK